MPLTGSMVRGQMLLRAAVSLAALAPFAAALRAEGSASRDVGAGAAAAEAARAPRPGAEQADAAPSLDAAGAGVGWAPLGVAGRDALSHIEWLAQYDFVVGVTFVGEGARRSQMGS